MITKCLACQCQFISTDGIDKRFNCPHCKQAFRIAWSFGTRAAITYAMNACAVSALLGLFVFQQIETPGMSWTAAMLAIEIVLLAEASVCAATSKYPWNDPAIAARWWILLCIGSIVPVVLLLSFASFLLWALIHLGVTIAVAIGNAQPKGATKLEILSPRLFLNGTCLTPGHATEEEMRHGEQIHLALLASSREFAHYAVGEGELTPRTDRMTAFSKYADQLTQLLFVSQAPSEQSFVAPLPMNGSFALEAVLKRLETELYHLTERTSERERQLSSERQAAISRSLASAVWEAAYKVRPEAV